ncbi:MAG: methyltransferase domain-containing protein [Alphaproteobacteria bacterium]|nr:methyltransferase domain-containing protein [Alphaproteobacteria bacterium]
MPDIFQSIDELDSDKQTMVADRLENRAKLDQFAAIRERYFDKIGLPATGTVHELGCGTGVVCRAIAARPQFAGTVTGSDLSASLIDVATEMTAKSGLSNVRFFQADGQGSDQHDMHYDLVLAHTTISHVSDPKAFLNEAVRLAKPGGKVVIHDGDYASMTFDTSTPALDLEMSEKILQAVVANRYVMRQMPRLLKEANVDITHAIGDVVLEAGNGEYLPMLARNYCPIAVSAGLARQADVDVWLSALDRALSESVFFGSCSFATYCAAKPH